jgi:hypothetical protein
MILAQNIKFTYGFIAVFLRLGMNLNDLLIQILKKPRTGDCLNLKLNMLWDDCIHTQARSVASPESLEIDRNQLL